MLNYYLYRLGQFIAKSVPLKTAYGIAVFVSDIRYFFTFRDRRIIRENLQAIFPDKPLPQIRRIQRLVFRNFAKYLVDFFRYELMDNEYIEKNIHIENIENFRDGLNRGKGVIVLSAHLGNWELGGVVIALSGYPFWVVALPHKEKKVNDFFNHQREIKKIGVIPLGKAVRQCLSLLKENKLVALVGDRDFTEKGAILDFFGKPAIFPEGPAALALQTNAVIIPGFMLRNPDDSFTLKIEKPLEINPTGNKFEDIKKIMSDYIKIFEQYIRQYPEQWYIFRRFWVNN